MPIKHWSFKKSDESTATRLAEGLKLPLLVARVLAARGYDTIEKAGAFLSGSSLTDPMSLKDMDKAVARIRQAAKDGERVAVYGDYDCDGIMSTVLLYSYLESMGVDVCYYIPDRDREGYGMNKNALKQIHDYGVSLVVTVDNGVTALEEVDYAVSIGLDVVVTDHHKPRDILPRAVAVVDPHRLDDESGCEYLAGVGVAFKLACALEGSDDEMMLDQYGDLVTVATIADIVPLSGENRLIVQRGMELLQNTGNEGLAALIRVCGMADKALTCENIAYGIVPRINSAGRFDQADQAIELFAGGADEPDTLAGGINALNEKRREIEDQIVAQIMERINADEQLLRHRVIVICGENWHHGIVGIVASRMVERFGKPCIVLSIEGETSRGSGRSIEGFSIIDAINACSEHLTRYGGHNQAAGLTVRTDRISDFIEAINRWAEAHHPQMPQQTLRIDCTISPRVLTVEGVQPLSMLEPFGSGNETPVFVVKNCTLQGIYPIGDGKHLRLRFSGDGVVFYAVYFGMTQQSFPYAAGDAVDLAVTADVGEWNGELRVSVKIRDIHLAGIDYDQIHHSEQLYQQIARRETLEKPVRVQVCPNRDEIAVVYRYLRSRGEMEASDELLYARLCESISSLCKLKIALDVLDEMRLITCRPSSCGKSLSVVRNPEKVDISSSKILRALQA